jgi:hypothetical protein
MSGTVAFLVIVAAMTLLIVLDSARPQERPWRRDLPEDGRA